MVPALINSLDRDSANIAMVDSNLHPEKILPSEKAFAYKMKFDAMNHQGRTSGKLARNGLGIRFPKGKVVGRFSGTSV